MRYQRYKNHMTTSYKPSGYTSVAPYLIVDGASRTIDFLVQAFDATPLRRTDDSSGKIRHAEVRIDDTVLMIADSVEGWPAISSNVHLYVPDVDATYEQALKAGAVSVQAPVQKGDVDKRGGVKDAGGTTWWIATEVEHVGS
jgi:PhnB protein